jgi:hypothetical protein
MNLFAFLLPDAYTGRTPNKGHRANHNAAGEGICGPKKPRVMSGRAVDQFISSLIILLVQRFSQFRSQKSYVARNFKPPFAAFSVQLARNRNFLPVWSKTPVRCVSSDYVGQGKQSSGSVPSVWYAGYLIKWGELHSLSTSKVWLLHSFNSVYSGLPLLGFFLSIFPCSRLPYSVIPPLQSYPIFAFYSFDFFLFQIYKGYTCIEYLVSAATATANQERGKKRKKQKKKKPEVTTSSSRSVSVHLRRKVSLATEGHRNPT